LNLCRPDSHKSCAACCGLYNVPDARRARLEEKLTFRTLVFGRTQKSPDALEQFKDVIRTREAVTPVEEIIHVCEFTGYLDPEHRIVGCMLHPSSPGNGGIDLRGLCHYGSLACKAFFCPAWTEISPDRQRIIADTVQDWHLYGLVITDVDYVQSIFHLLECGVGMRLDPDVLRSGPAGSVLCEIFSWKDSWPFKGDSMMRRCRYYVKGEHLQGTRKSAEGLQAIRGILEFTFDLKKIAAGSEQYISSTVQRFVSAYLRERRNAAAV